MAASMAAMSVMSTSALLSVGGLSSKNVRGLGFSNSTSSVAFFKGGSSVKARTPGYVSRRGVVRCDFPQVGDSIRGVRDTVDSASKTTITREDVEANQQTNESEKKSVFGTSPSSGSSYPRPEVERRPETGSTDLDSIFAFDGVAPETINGRLAMVGLVWAFVAERASGLTVFEQLYSTAGVSGLVYFILLTQAIAFASLVPFVKGESTDARRFGPFRAKAERWNGRLAMLGFLALVVIEQFTKSPVFASWF